jgi:hypothetical protein
LFHSSHEHDTSWCGEYRRLIVAAMEKFIDELQILDDPFAGPPDL